MPDTDKGFIFADEAEAQAACEWWQRELRLQDWDIKCWIKRQEELSSEAQASYRITPEHKEGWIKILDHIDWPSDTSWAQDQEKSLVHELMHIQTDACAPKDHDVPYEQAVELTARALVHLRRLAYPERPWKTQ